ncbi:jg9854 [Pararge aegeria aegeria]|uniref:Jg9854 protein n=1 Tax=Pararge aegeria aegeria TaxID=348720 RepID=A0A8S4QR96_9NEOP|nr:jg9854 [Pararge aegeria aegeria]
MCLISNRFGSRGIGIGINTIDFPWHVYHPIRSSYPGPPGAVGTGSSSGNVPERRELFREALHSSTSFVTRPPLGAGHSVPNFLDYRFLCWHPLLFLCSFCSGCSRAAAGMREAN